MCGFHMKLQESLLVWIIEYKSYTSAFSIALLNLIIEKSNVDEITLFLIGYKSGVYLNSTFSLKIFSIKSLTSSTFPGATSLYDI